jgi:DNA-binding NtrC family response regulator
MFRALASLPAPGANPPAPLDGLQAIKILALALLSATERLDESTAERAGQINLAEEVRRFEIALIRSALQRTGGRQRRAARLLGLKVSTLNAKIKRYQLDATEVAHTSSTGVLLQ